ncbi:MAG: hypothetical protein M9916_12810 [Crocinitomicaceae bacterium]|nr:hypothetical protein [Crocinitomicaceae bacterium]
MKRITYIALFFSVISMVACKSAPQNNEETEEDAIETIENEAIDPMLLADSTKKAHEIKEHQENLKAIEKKYGEQWGFCECVVANDSIDKAVKNLKDFETPEAEKLLERFEYVSNKCQAFLGMDASATPEQRAKHEKKVKKCLKDAKANKK